MIKTSFLFDNSALDKIPINLSLATAVLILLSLGIIMVASASMDISNAKYGDPFYYTKRHCAHIILGLFLTGFVFLIPTSIWYKWSWLILFATICILIMVLIPGINYEAKGSARWIKVGGITLQASEMAKVGLIIYFSSYLVRHQEHVQSALLGLLKPLLVIIVIGALLLAEPDYGAIAVIVSTMLGMFFLAGARLSQFIFMLLIVLSFATIFIFTEEYRYQRIQTFLDPWSDPFAGGYQLTQALIAFGRGEWVGIGIGNSIQKLFYLPEAHTDFLFAVIVEELGVVSLVAIIAGYAFVVFKALSIGYKASIKKQYFSCFIAYGIGLLIGIQALINMSVNMGLLPTKGLTLPLMSYGGSSILASLIAIGLLLRIDFETKIIKVRTTGNSTRKVKANNE